MQRIHSAIASAIGITIVGFTTAANAYPELKYVRIDLNSDVGECVRKGSNALRKNRFQYLEVHRDKRYNYNWMKAYKPEMKVIVDCKQVSQQKTYATIMFAGEGAVNQKEIDREIANLRKSIQGDSVNTSNQPNPMSQEQFASFMQAFTRELNKPFDSKPLRFLAQPSTSNSFTAQQVREITKKLSGSFSDSHKRQLEAAVMLYPRVVDKSNWYLVDGIVTSRNQLRARIEKLTTQKDSSVNTSNQPNPMSQEQFASFMQAFTRELNKPFDSKPLRFLAQPSTNNSFTAQQVREITKKLSGSFSDSHKRQLEAAVMLYPRVVDKSNWYLVDGIVTSRNQLRARIEKLTTQKDSSVNTSNQPNPMSQEQFASFMQAFTRELNKPFDSKPLRFLAQPSTNNSFTAQEVREITKKLSGSFSDSHKRQLEAAVMLYPRVVDKSNWYLVDDIVVSKKQLRTRIENLKTQQNR